MFTFCSDILWGIFSIGYFCGNPNGVITQIGRHEYRDAELDFIPDDISLEQQSGSFFNSAGRRL